MARPIASVHVDIARLTFEYSRVSADSTEELVRARAKWIDDLVACLALRNPMLSTYGAFLLTETEEYRRADSERKRGQNGQSVSKESVDSTESPLRSDRSDQTDLNPPPTPSGGLKSDFEKARKAWPGTRRGFSPEWENFQRKYARRAAEIVPLLLPAISRYRTHVERKAKADNKPPFWQNFKTWINQEGWTAEYPGAAVLVDSEGRARAKAHYAEHGFYPSGTPNEWMGA
jgi:hypothetical protein